ncbi:MAG: adenosine kinase [Deltaproteobacteria bacterium]|nr:adenosine kinase [Deltaproteobacteria bacterium]
MKYDVFGLGNPLIDIILHVDDTFMTELRLEKGSMNLVDTERQKEILKKAATHQITTALGGSAANTMVMTAQLGGKTAYGGKLGKDPLGDDYQNQLIKNGVTSYLVKQEGMTGSTIILVNPDAERTMNTHLGMCQAFSKENISKEGIQNASYLYVEGYLWDTEVQQEGVITALEYAKAAETKIALSLSDSFCVERHKEKFQRLMDNYVDILFCNDQEASLMTNEIEPEEQLKKISQSVDHIVLTLGKKGSKIRCNDSIVSIDAFQTEAIDTTGAGDSFAAGYLYGITQGFTIEKAGTLAAYCAATIVGQNGPRYDGDFRECVAQYL